MDYYGLGYEQDGSRVVVKDARGSVLTATFDEHNRLTSLEAEMSAGEEPPAESWDEAQIRRMLRG